MRRDLDDRHLCSCKAQAVCVPVTEHGFVGLATGSLALYKS